MTSTVTPLHSAVDMQLVARLFVRYKGRYGGLWTCRASSEQEWQFVMRDWHQELSKFRLCEVNEAIEKSLLQFTDRPPSLAQLVQLCMAESGVPEAHDVIRMMIARDFSHPITKMLYDKIGSWTLNNGKADEIERKVKEHYTRVKADFHAKPKIYWAELEAYNAKPKELPPPPKIPSNAEMKGFRDCLSKCHELLKVKKVDSSAKPYREFDANKIKPNHKEFDKHVFNQYREYLMSIPEEQTMILPPVYLLDRNKFLNMRDQQEWLRKIGYKPDNQQIHHENTERSRNNQPVKLYKNWVHD